MTSSTGGKVGNMRALFEAKQDLSSSPPSRGRSPAGSDIHSIRSGSSRPVSKIRTSFVAVEKSGTMGTILGLRRVSDVQDKPELDVESRQSGARSISNTGRESIAEERELENKDAVEKQNEVEVKQDLDGEAVPAVDNGTEDIVGMSSLTTSKEKKAVKHIPTGIKTQVKPESSKVNGTAMKKQPVTPKDTSGKSKADTQKPTALRTKPLSDSPRATGTKTKTSIASPKDSGPASRARALREPITKPESRVSTPRTSLASNGRKEDKPIKTRSKSPTRPVRLPAAAMASTASSAAKTAGAEKPSSQGSSRPRVSSDNDFLARMMRPTTASASKTHEKLAPNSGPQKSVLPKPKRTSEANEASGRRTSGSVTKPTPIKSDRKSVRPPTSSKDESTSEQSRVEVSVEDKSSANNVVESNSVKADKIENDLETMVVNESTETNDTELQKQVEEAHATGLDSDVTVALYEADAVDKDLFRHASEDKFPVPTADSSLPANDHESSKREPESAVLRPPEKQQDVWERVELQGLSQNADTSIHTIDEPTANSSNSLVSDISEPEKIESPIANTAEEEKVIPSTTEATEPPADPLPEPEAPSISNDKAEDLPDP